MVDSEASVDENDDGATIAAVTTENSSEVTVDDDRFEVADGSLKLKDGSSLDFEADSSPIEVTLTAVSDGDDATATVSISINDVNEAPSIDVRDGEEVPGHPGVISSLSVDENAMRGEGGPPPLALIEVMDPDAADADMLTGDAGEAATSVSDSRFAVIQDPENGLWLHLAEGASLNYEDASEVTVTVTYTDSAGNTASADVTVMVNDVNEAPIAVGEVPTVTALAGKAIDVEVDLTSLFNDPDAGDAGSLRWELSGNPSWLGLQVEYVTDDSGNEKVIGHLRGTPPTTGAESNAAHMVTLTATDRGGESGSVTFYSVVDEANDDITSVDLLDDNGNAVSEVEVDENDASGVVLAEVRVDDPDHPMHPNGMHLVTVDDDRFEIRDQDGRKWLALKEGVSLNHEQRGEGGVIEVEITAIDMNGEQNSLLDRAFGAPRYKGDDESATFTILVNDLNDAPRAGTIGNWWVTVDEDRYDDPETVDEGDLLTVTLETQGTTGDNFPAFRDDDLSAGDSLTYSISGPGTSWVQIDERSGRITNKEGIIPNRGVYSVTVTATDEDGESASASFNLNVAKSGQNNNVTEDNRAPSIRKTSERDYNENSGEQLVATFTVTDTHQDLPDHLFAIKTVRITSVVSADTNRGIGESSDDPRNATTFTDHDSDPTTPDILTTTVTTDDADEEGFAGAFRLSEPRKSGNTLTYDVYVRDTNPLPGNANDTTRQLNPDHANPDSRVEKIDITVEVTDGTGASDDVVIRVDIEDVNERPTANAWHRFFNTTGLLTNTDREVNQSEDEKVFLYINLEALWSDDRDEDDELVYGASESSSWIDILHGPGEWEDVIKGPDGDTGGGDDLSWPDGTDPNQRAIGTAPTGATDDVWVVVVEIDRTDTGSQAQGDQGSFTLTARDENGATNTLVLPVIVDDENEDIGADAVTISGSAREGSTLRARFNENKDPDLAGDESPVLVMYTWSTVNPTTNAETVIQVTTGEEPLRLTQSHVGMNIKVAVTYYEVFDGQFISAGDLDGQLGIVDSGGSTTATNVDVEATTERMVTNSPDAGVGHFTITVGTNTLTASAVIQDEDYGVGSGPVAANITYKWQVSANGVGGWRDAPDDGDSDSNSATYEVDDGEGQYYRAVAMYSVDPAEATDATADKEEVASQAIQIADVADLAAGSTPTAGSGDTVTPGALTPSGSPFPGGTLSVRGSTIASVQWQLDSPAPGTAWTNIPGATGNALNLTAAHAGSTVRALVTYESAVPGEPGVTAVVASNTVAIQGSSASARPTAVANQEITGSVMGTGHAAIGPVAGDGVTSGHTVSITEMVDLGSLFQDPDSARLSFTVNGESGNANSLPSGGTTVYDQATQRTAGSFVYQSDEGVLVLELRSGKLTYESDQLRGHDGDDADGAGNWLLLDITADDSRTGDGTGNSTASATMGNVRLRINVAPTDVEFAEGDTGSGSLDSDNDNVTDVTTTNIINTYTADTNDATQITGITVNERVEATGREVLARIDVQDENFAGTSTRPGHSFGVHEVTVVGDDRFVITKSGGSSALKDSDGDGSTWELRLVRGSTFDHETDDMDPFTDGTQIELTFMATDGGGLSTPIATGAEIRGGNGYIPITVVVTVANDTRDDPRHPAPNETPGLKDDETNDTDDTADDTDSTTGDGDTDGGDPTPPPPGMSLGGVIEDFIDNMDGYDQDLLEDYLLTIDDGLDIA